MKKSLLFAFFIALSAVLTLISCSDEKKEMIESLNYKKACELKDFATAYEIVDKLKEKTSEKKSDYELYKNEEEVRSVFYSEYKEAKKISDEAERYVMLQESITVIESNGIDGLMRIVVIAKEHNAESWLYSELFDVAKKIGNTDLAERIQNMAKLESKIDTEE